MPHAAHVDSERNQEILETDAAWAAATPGQRAAAAGLDLAALAGQARRRTIAAAAALGGVTTVLYAGFTIFADRATGAGTGDLVWLAAGAGVVLLTLLVAQALVALVDRLRGGMSSPALSLAMACANDLILVAALVTVRQAQAQAQVASDAVPWPLMLGVGFVVSVSATVYAIQAPVAVLRTAGPAARRGARAMLDLDPRWTGIGAGIGWVVAGHALGGVAAAASVAVVFASPSPWAGVPLAAVLIAADVGVVVAATRRRMGWALVVAAAGTAVVVAWAVAAVGAG